MTLFKECNNKNLCKTLPLQGGGQGGGGINRGRRGEVIFSRKENYYVFMDLLKKVVDKYNVRLVKGAIRALHEYEEYKFHFNGGARTS